MYTGSLSNLHRFLSELNNIHPTIKFTMTHTTPSDTDTPDCGCPPSSSLAFLDTSCKIVGGQIVTDLYRKETDRNQYLLTSSCHPAHTTQNIPYSLALRIVRICSQPEDREQRFEELKNLLLARDYKPGIIQTAIQRARSIPRSEALKKVERQKHSQRPVFVIGYDPRLPSINQIINRHWRTMQQDPYMAEVFPQPPLVAYKRPPNIKDRLIRAKVPDPSPARPKRIITGMKKCNKCPICPYVQVGQTIKATQINYTKEINSEVNCQTKNLIYLIGCQKCKEQYVGETSRSLQERFSEHLGYVKNKHLNKVTGEHFNTKGHNHSDMKISIIEKLHSNSDQYRKQREKMFISKFNTKYKGMNQKS